MFNNNICFNFKFCCFIGREKKTPQELKTYCKTSKSAQKQAGKIYLLYLHFFIRTIESCYWLCVCFTKDDRGYTCLNIERKKSPLNISKSFTKKTSNSPPFMYRLNAF